MIYCFDLDGTLCTQRDGDYENAQPFKDRIAHVNKLHKAGHKIIIETARGSGKTKGKDWTTITNLQLLGWGLLFDESRTGIKFSADVYVDDRSIHPEQFFNPAVKQ